MSMMFPSFQLLELNIISAQDLAPVARKMKTYAVAWVHSERKLTTRVDYNGGANPTWNDKFVFRVNEEFLYADTSAVVIEIYALHWFRDVHVGTVRVLVSNLIPPNRRPGYRTTNNEYRRTPPPGMRFVALQVRRTSGRPQGILNIGVGVLDGSMRSMPLYTHMDSSAVGYRDLLGEEDRHLQHLHLNSNKGSSKNPQSPSTSRQFQSVVSRPELRRTKSDTSSMVVSDLLSRAERSRLATRKPASAVASSESEEAVPTTTTDSEDAYTPPNNTHNVTRQRYDSIESDLTEPSTMVKPNVHVVTTHEPPTQPYNSHHQPRKTPRKTPMHEKQRPVKDYNHRGRASPYLSRHGTPLRSNIVASTPMQANGIRSTPMRSNMVGMSPMRPNMVELTPMQTPRRSNMYGTTPRRSNIVASTPIRSNYKATPMKSHHNYGTPMRSSNFAGRRILTDSELGPSSSEMMKNKAHNNETESSILSDWSVDDSSIEGARSKLEMWRTELPPLYDIGSSQVSSTDYDGSVVYAPNGGKSSRRKTPAGKNVNRRHSSEGNGLFSCFSKICGVECSFVCGGGGGGGGGDESKKGGGGGRVHRTYSADDLSSL
ncbi:unnamed protein product [Eruca vesicaria subsp. sativa]|uniref:C2 domain-containing protein n=1 Tax=Eruca vesicaria subsp. sativa TaxID=29727 RepID=A0ABC8L4N1_ERUVS|nr:unnamed protein product [Eruca vesicaria subsp. sativa]